MAPTILERGFPICGLNMNSCLENYGASEIFSFVSLYSHIQSLSSLSQEDHWNYLPDNTQTASFRLSYRI
jgi:hypothetical protein